MLLSQYQAAVNSLIQAPSSPTPLVPVGTITNYINTARRQTAADAECVRFWDTVSITSNPIQFISLAGPTDQGMLYPISIRQLILGTAMRPLEARSWDWFWNYRYAVDRGSGRPTLWAQLGQGTSGTLWLHPSPDATYSIIYDAVMLPIDLVDDSTVDAIPYPWTDAVSFYAAWLALMQLQRPADADEMLSRYKEMALRGRQESTPTALPDNYQGGQGTQIATAKTTLTQRFDRAVGGGR